MCASLDTFKSFFTWKYAYKDAYVTGQNRNFPSNCELSQESD